MATIEALLEMSSVDRRNSFEAMEDDDLDTFMTEVSLSVVQADVCLLISCHHHCLSTGRRTKSRSG